MEVNKRFMVGIVVLLCCSIMGFASGAAEAEDIIMTVQGPIPASEFGMALPHEHIVGSFTKKESIEPYEKDRAFETMLPLLRAAKIRGYNGIVEATPVDLSRDVEVLLRLSEETGLHLVTNTGNYGAFGDSLLLPYGFSESADQLSARWIDEFENGIAGTGIKPGFIKIAIDAGHLSEVDRKLVLAAAKTHLQTGLTIYCHTAEAVAAKDILDLLRSEGVHPSALVVAHSDEIPDQEVHFMLAEAGAWVAYDHVGRANQTVEGHVTLIMKMLEKGYVDRLLVSHDSLWFDVSDPEGWMEFAGNRLHPSLGGAPWAATITEDLIPALEGAGVAEADINKLFVENPADAITIV